MTVPAAITPDWIRARASAAGVSQREVARILDVDERTARRWFLGEREMPRAAAILLDARLYLRDGDTASAIHTIADDHAMRA